MGPLCALFRYGTATLANANGDCDYKFALNAIEQQLGYYEDLAIMFEEVRVDVAVASFFLSPAVRYTAAQGGLGFQVLVHGAMHRLLPVGAQSQANALSIAALRTFSPMTSVATAVWRRREDDASENEFYPAQGGVGVDYIPASLGGFFLWMDGPISAANLTLGTFVFEYTLTFRGLRYLSIVGPPAIRILPQALPEPQGGSAQGEDDSIIVLGGKKYCRLGEAKNPGPDESSDDDDDDDPPNLEQSFSLTSLDYHGV
jgi:hypothetical protein